MLRRMAAAAALLFAVVTGCNWLIDTNELSDGKCPAGKKPCPEVGECVSITANTGCNRDSCAPCSIEHGRAKCDDETKACALFDCDEGYWHCYSDTACDTDIHHDPKNCGSCGFDCTLTAKPNTYAGCSAGRCVSGGCLTGYKDCNSKVGGNDDDGCEIGPDAPCPADSTQSP
jgi:hypothetical protein